MRLIVDISIFSISLNMTNTCKRGVFKHNATNSQMISGQHVCVYGIKVLRVLIYGGDVYSMTWGID